MFGERFNGTTFDKGATVRTPLRLFVPSTLDEAVECPRSATPITCRRPSQKRSQHLTTTEYQSLCSTIPAATTQHRLSDAERPIFSRRTSLWSLYLQLEEGAWGKVGKKLEKAPTTWHNYRSAIRVWCEFMRPATLSEDMNWPGLNLETIERLTAEQWQELIDEMEDEFSAGYIGKLWTSLRFVLNVAKRINAIRFYVQPELPALDDLRRAYTPDEVERLWRHLKPHPLLRSAFVVSLNCGLRTNDLLGLPWSALQQDVNGRPVLDFRARKTGKHQRLPLAPITVAAIERCRSVTGQTPWMFWGLTNPAAKFPERTAFALARRALQREIWAAAEIRDLKRPAETICKPWQVGRATCATRYETYHLGVGAFVLAHSLQGVTARNYTEPTQLVWDAVLNVPQYDCFRELLSLA
jgi:integrase